MIYGTGGESVKKNSEVAKQYFKLACENGVNC
jgi:TPR repeat protein